MPAFFGCSFHSQLDFFFSQGLRSAFGGGANSAGGAGAAARPAAAVASARQSMEGREDSEGDVAGTGAVIAVSGDSRTGGGGGDSRGAFGRCGAACRGDA